MSAMNNGPNPSAAKKKKKRKPPTFGKIKDLLDSNTSARDTVTARIEEVLRREKWTNLIDLFRDNVFNKDFWSCHTDEKAKQVCLNFVIEQFQFVLARDTTEYKQQHKKTMKRLRNPKTPLEPAQQQTLNELNAKYAEPTVVENLFQSFSTIASASTPIQAESTQRTELEANPGINDAMPVSTDYSPPTSLFRDWDAIEVSNWLQHVEKLEQTVLNEFTGVTGGELLDLGATLSDSCSLPKMKCQALLRKMKRLDDDTAHLPASVLSDSAASSPKPPPRLPIPSQPTTTVADGSAPLGTLRLEQLVVHVAKPLLIRQIHIWWNKYITPGFKCAKCGAGGNFSDLKSCCLWKVVNDGYYYQYEVDAQNIGKSLQSNTNRVAKLKGELLLNIFDVGKLNVLCGMSIQLYTTGKTCPKYAIDDVFDGYVVDIYFVVVLQGRNIPAHERWSDNQARPHIEILIKKCKEMMNQLPRRSTGKLFAQPLVSGANDDAEGAKDDAEVMSTIKKCQEALTDLAIDLAYKTIVYDSAHAGTLQWALRLFEPSPRQVGKTLLRSQQLFDQFQSDTPKVLVIPPVPKALRYNLATQFKALLQVKWTSILDLSGDNQFWSDGVGDNYSHLFAMPDIANVFNFGVAHCHAYVLATPKCPSSTKHHDGAMEVIKMWANYSLTENVNIIANNRDMMDSDKFDDVFRTLAVKEVGGDPTAAVSAILCDIALLDLLLAKHNTLLLPGCEPAVVRPIQFSIIKTSKIMQDAEILDVDCDIFDVEDEDVEGEASRSVKERQLSHDFFDYKLAHWRLFRTGVVVKRRDVDKIKDIIFKKNDSVTLHHGSLAGGSTVARFVLYELRFRFVCVILTKLESTTLSYMPIVSTIKLLHDKTGLNVLVLLDVPKHVKVYDLGVKLASLPHCRVLKCVHDTGDYANSNGWQNVVLQELTSEEFKKITDKVLSLNKSRRLLPFDSVPLDTYLEDVDGTLNTDKIKKEAQENKGKPWPYNWQESIINQSRENPKSLLDIGLLIMEVFELSRTLRGGSNLTKILQLDMGNQTQTRPLIHCGFMALCRVKDDSQPHYKKLIERAESFICQVLNESNALDLEILKLVVFGALFAPGVPIDTNVFAQGHESVQLSARVRSLVRQINVGGSNPYIMIDVPMLAEMLATKKELFGNSSSTKNLVSFLKEKLPPYLKSRQIKVLVHVAFCEFKIWHFDGFGKCSNTKRATKFSTLIELCRENYMSFEAVELFHNVAMCYQRRHTHQEFDDKQRKMLNNISVSMITHACRLRGEITLSKGHCHFNRLNQYRIALDLIEGCSEVLQNYTEMKFRQAIIYRFLLLAFANQEDTKSDAKSCPCNALENDKQDWSKIEQREWDFSNDSDAFAYMFSRSKEFLSTVISDSRHAWAHPLLTFVQLILDFQNTKTFEDISKFEDISECADLLCETFLTIKYHKEINEFSSTEDRIYNVINTLLEVPERITVLGSSWRKETHTTDALTTTLYSLTDPKKFSSSIGMMEALMVVSTKHAAQSKNNNEKLLAFNSSNRITQDFGTLRTAMVHWRTEVDSGRAHGLGPAMSCVMLTLFSCIFKNDRQNNRTLLLNDNFKLQDLAKDFNYVSKPRFFVRIEPALEDQPLTAFVSTDTNDCNWEIYRNHCKTTKLEMGLSPLLTEEDETECFKRLEGDGIRLKWFNAKVSPNGEVILWQRNLFIQPFNVPFDHDNNQSVKGGDSVKFVIGLRMRGLKAFGVSLSK